MNLIKTSPPPIVAHCRILQDILRVAPLFETLDDLTNAPGTIKTLFSNEWYLKHIKGSQECMIGEKAHQFEVSLCGYSERHR